MTVDLRGTGVTGKELEKRLDEGEYHGEQETPFLTTPKSPPLPAVCGSGPRRFTTRGFGVAEMEEIAGFIADCIFDFENKKEQVAAGVAALTARFPLYE